MMKLKVMSRSANKQQIQELANDLLTNDNSFNFLQYPYVPQSCNLPVIQQAFSYRRQYV